MKTRLLIIIGIIATSTIIFFVLGPSQGHISEYFLTDGQFEDMILNIDNTDRYLTYDESNTCPDGQDYNKVLFKCVISCKDGLVYNGYTDSCTTEFELKYRGFCDNDFTYSPSLHVCLGKDSGIQHVPLKDPPRTAPPEPELENEN